MVRNRKALMISIPEDLQQRMHLLKRKYGVGEYASRVCVSALYDYVIDLENKLGINAVLEIEEHKQSLSIQDVQLPKEKEARVEVAAQTEERKEDGLVEVNPTTLEEKPLSKDESESLLQRMRDRIKKMGGEQ